MKLRKNISKIGALTGSALMASLSVAAPVAANLDDLPQPFIQDGEFNGSLVVGEEAQTEDVLGAIDIASSFQAEATSPVSVGGGGSVTVEGGEDFQEYVGSTFDGETLDDSNLEGFADDDVEVEDTDYDYEELFNIGGGNNQIATSAFTSYSEDENYDQDAYMELGEADVDYELSFEDQIPEDAFDDDEMDIEFLGSQLEVQDIGTDSDQTITVRTSNEYTLEAGDTVEVDGHEVTLERVGESSVLVSVDGQQKAISYPGDNDATFDEADDFEVEVDSAFYEEGASDNLAVLNLGGSITETYQDGEALEIFGGADDDDEATWTWDIDIVDDGGTNDLTAVGVDLNHDYNRWRDSPDEDERNAIPLEGELELPNNRAALQFAGWDDSEMEDYEDVDMQIRNEDFSNFEDASGSAAAANTAGDATSGDFLQVTTDEDNLHVNAADGSDYEAEEVYFYADGTDLTGDGDDSPEEDIAVFFDDGDDEYFAGYVNDGSAASSASVDLEISDETINFDWSGFDTTTVSPLSMDFNAGGSDGAFENFEWDLETDTEGFNSFGDTASEAESGDFAYEYEPESNSAGTTETLSGTDDEPRRSAYGVTWDDAEGMLDSDEFEMSVPAAGQEANLLATSSDSRVSEESSDSGAVEVNRIPVGLGVLDSDVVSNGEITGEGPMVVVGGPYANTAASALLDNPSSSEIESMFSPGQATIRMFDEPEALLVAGYNPEDTVGASLVVADYQDYSEQLTGDEVELVFDGSEDIEFQSPSMNASQ